MQLKISSQKLGLFVLLTLITTLSFSQNQSYSISGTITNGVGEPLIGVTIMEDNTTRGTISDYDGKYTISGMSDSTVITLQFSYLGYSSQSLRVDASENQLLDVIMIVDILKLDEVVITGASAATAKKNLGNAISTVSGTELNRGGAQGIDQALSGKLPGALVNQNSGNPAGGVSVTLRGNSTVFGSSDPLYIIDGVIVDNSSPEIIDLGGYTQNRLVDINPNDIEKIEIIKGAAAAAIYRSRASNGVVQIFTKKGTVGKPRINFSTSYKVNSLRKEINENLEPFSFEAVNDANNSTLIPATRFKMQDFIFGTGVGTDNYLSVSGGDGNTRYYLSGSANYNEGIIKNSDFTRYTSRVNVDQVISDKLSAGIGMGYTHSTSTEIPNGGISEFYGALTGYNFNNNNYDPRADAGGNFISPAGFVPNPVEVIERFKFGQNTSRFNGNFNVKYNPFKGFGIDMVVGFDTYTQTADGFIPVGSTVKGTGWARSASFNNLLINADLNLRYTTDLKSNISSTSLLGFTLQHDESRFLSLTSDNLSPVVNSTSAGSIISRGDTKSERNIQGAFFQQTLGIDKKLFITGAVRIDAASPFGIDERSQIYPKASVSYLLSESAFMKDNTLFDLVKVRVSYGESGNLSALAAYERLSNYNPAPITGQTGLIPSSRLGNAGLKPERQKEIEVGFDLGLLDNRLGLEFTVYNVKVEDLLLTRILSPSTGYGTRLENVGEMTNKGFEVLLIAAPILKQNLDWVSTLTFSKNSNEVNGIEGNQIALPKSFGVSLARNGEPIGILDGFIYARDANGEILLENGLPSRAVDANGVTIRQTLGDPNPDLNGSWINEVNIKDFSFRMQLDAVLGFDVFNFTDRVNSRSRFGGGPRDAEEVRGELARGYNNAAYNIWERYIEDGSFVKVREISFGYTIKPSSANISSLKFSIIGRNLFSFDSYSGWDPEVSTAGQTNGVRGFDFNEVPIPRTLIFGLNASF